jgi:hypothetical protein
MFSPERSHLCFVAEGDADGAIIATETLMQLTGDARRAVLTQGTKETACPPLRSPHAFESVQSNPAVVAQLIAPAADDIDGGNP